MLIAVEGCMHGELSAVYTTLMESLPPHQPIPQLLICCGDFQAVRNRGDLECLAVPSHFRTLGDFHLYFSGQKKAPILTIFIGGNHEASNHSQELPYGGWVAPNIYFLGNASVITIGGIRIGGVSGIYKGRDYLRGHFESPPYTEDTKRSVYHYRNLEMFRLQQLSGDLDIFVSHDWPSDITNHGNSRMLIKRKPFFENDILCGKLGSPPLQKLMECLEPKYWFAAHLHCKFPALVPKKDGISFTRFLALDKCLPKRKFLQILDIPHDESIPMELQYDLEWLTILRLTNHLLSVRYSICHMPGKESEERWNFTPSDEEKQQTLRCIGGDLSIRKNFRPTTETLSSEAKYGIQKMPVLNPQNSEFCSSLQIDDPVSLIMIQKGLVLKSPSTYESSKIILDKETDVATSNIPILPLQVTPPVLLSQPNTPLSLPEPIQKYEDFADGKFLGDSSLNETINSGIIETSECETPISTKKKFNRRNESLYKSNLEED